MAFSDYTDLRVAVAEQVGRSDIADVMDRFTLLAEARFNHRLRVGQQIKTANVFAYRGRAKLPADYLEVVKPRDAERRGLEPMPAQSDARGYAVDSGGAILPDGRHVLQYYAKIPTLTAGATTKNWLLTEFPALYLYAVAGEASKHLRQPDEARIYAQMAEDEIQALKMLDTRARYSRARVRVEGHRP